MRIIDFIYNSRTSILINKRRIPMNFFNLILKNLLSLPLLCFGIGILGGFLRPNSKILSKITPFITIYLLLAIGVKGGGPLVQYASSSLYLFLSLALSMVVWAFLQPFLSFFILKRSTDLESSTAAAVAASFGSISVMTFIAAVSFLEQMNIQYERFIIPILAMLDVPAIIAGLFLAKAFGEKKCAPSKMLSLLYEAIANKAIIAILSGLMLGAILQAAEWQAAAAAVMYPFKPLLCIFLLEMGFKVGKHKEHFHAFSWQLSLFGFYMPLIGGAFALALSYFLKFDAGTATLTAVLAASASYIAVPAAIRIALPQAKEAVYLPLSLGITFPFNIIIGIPLYYQIACWLFPR